MLHTQHKRDLCYTVYCIVCYFCGWNFCEKFERVLRLNVHIFKFCSRNKEVQYKVCMKVWRSNVHLCVKGYQVYKHALKGQTITSVSGYLHLHCGRREVLYWPTLLQHKGPVVTEVSVGQQPCQWTRCRRQNRAALRHLEGGNLMIYSLSTK